MKKWSISLLVCVLVCVLLFGVLTFVLDPMLRYRGEGGVLSYYTYNTLYTAPGAARQHTYDSVMVGTSMIQNTDVALCDELLGTDMIRLAFSGGTSWNMRHILEICFDSGNDISSVYWELDEFQLFGSADSPRYPLPEYLYAESYKDDLSYLLNLDIFYHFTLKDIYGTLKGETRDALDEPRSLGGDFGREAMLANYTRPVLSSSTAIFDETMKDKVTANLENIKALLEAYPDTQFVFFMVPFSVMYWDSELRGGTFDAVMDGVEYALGELLQYENAEVYFYQAEEEIITNLDNYKDFSHYGPWINDWTIASIAAGDGRVTLENYQEIISDMKSFVHGYDFDAVFLMPNVGLVSESGNAEVAVR